jgi:hypothetical protein
VTILLVKYNNQIEVAISGATVEAGPNHILNGYPDLAPYLSELVFEEVDGNYGDFILTPVLQQRATVERNLAASDADMARVAEDQVERFESFAQMLVDKGLIAAEDVPPLPQSAQDKIDNRKALRA